MPADQLYLAAVTIGDIRTGIGLTREQDPYKAEELEAWLDRALAACNILPLDSASFRVWAKLMHRQSDTLIQDATIAASASIHRLAVVTRNVRDFHRLGMRALNRYGERNQREASE